jgi:NAD(P)-dependent dehydrogenase (short-subunit alcohol dehydrogenase family)
MSMSERLLQDRVVIVTGAGRGVGRAAARLAAAEGARLVLADLGCDVEGNGADATVVGEIADELRAAGVEVEAFAVDVSAPGAVETLAERARARFGRLDGVVHAAGLWCDRTALRTSPELLERVLAVQLGAAFAWVRVAGQAMVEAKTGGSIVLLAGPSAFFGARGHAAMGAAQAGVVALARSAALELRRHRVRVNAVCPTARTRQTETLPTFAAIHEASLSPEHVASVIGFLLSDLAEEVHGEAYAIRARETTGVFGGAKPADPREVRGWWAEVLKP